MNKYEKGKIYKIVSNYTNEVYIGSTIQSLSQRMAGHRQDFKRASCSSALILEYGDARPYLIKYFPCNSREELEAEERQYIVNTDCVNKQIPGGRTPKEYYLANKDKFNKKEYYLANKEKFNRFVCKRYHHHYYYWYHRKHLFDILKPLFSDI